MHAPPSGAHWLQLLLQQNWPFPHTFLPHFSPTRTGSLGGKVVGSAGSTTSPSTGPHHCDVQNPPFLTQTPQLLLQHSSPSPQTFFPHLTSTAEGAGSTTTSLRTTGVNVNTGRFGCTAHPCTHIMPGGVQMPQSALQHVVPDAQMTEPHFPRPMGWQEARPRMTTQVVLAVHLTTAQGVRDGEISRVGMEGSAVRVSAGLGVARARAAREAAKRTAGSILGVGVRFVSRGFTAWVWKVSVSRQWTVWMGLLGMKNDSVRGRKRVGSRGYKYIVW